MKNISFLVLVFCLNSYAHEGEKGPSSLEEEFARSSHLHLPVSYSSTEGLSFGYHVGGHAHSDEHEHTVDHEHEEHDHSDHDHADHDHEEADQNEAHDADSHGDDTGIEFNVHPIVYGGFDKIRRIINQELSSANDLSLELAQEKSPYLLLEGRKWDLGLGLGVDSHLPNPLFGAGISLAKLKGKNYYSIRGLQHKNEIREELELPLDAEKLKSWRTGDQIFYSTKGGVIFSVLAGIDPIVHIGPGYIHSGIYKVKAALKSANVLEIEIQTINTDSIFFEAGAVILNSEANRNKGHARTIVYTFDLTNTNSFKAINYLFNGRLDLTNQEMISSGGAIRARASTLHSSVTFSGSFGLPIVYFNGTGSGVYQNAGQMEENHGNGEVHKWHIYSSSSIKERFTRGILSQHKWENRSVVSTVLRGDHSLLSTVFSWSFAKDKMNTRNLQGKLSRLARSFNLPWLKGIQFPKKNMGYLKADFTINMSGKDVLFILNTKQMEDLKVSAIEQLEADFKTHGHRAFCKIKTYRACLSHYKNLISDKAKHIKNLRTSVEDAYKDNQMTLVSDRLNQMTIALFSSKYLTYAFMSSRKNNLLLEVRLEGENIKKHIFGK